QALRVATVDRLERLRSGNHLAGWSDKAQRLVGEAAEIRKDDGLRDEAASTLVGVDSLLVRSSPKKRASPVAFAPTDNRLLLGGWDEEANKEEARLWDVTNGDPVPSGQTGAGPVAFRTDGTPVQLVRHPKNRRSLLLWDVARRRPLRELAFP